MAQGVPLALGTRGEENAVHRLPVRHPPAVGGPPRKCSLGAGWGIGGASRSHNSSGMRQSPPGLSTGPSTGLAAASGDLLLMPTFYHNLSG